MRRVDGGRFGHIHTSGKPCSSSAAGARDLEREQFKPPMSAEELWVAAPPAQAAALTPSLNRGP